MPESQGHLLEPKDNERIFRTRIIPGELSAATQQQHPIVVFIGGQTGAGKTAVADMITNALGRRGGFINANMDFYTPYHPHYPRVARADWSPTTPARSSKLRNADSTRPWRGSSRSGRNPLQGSWRPSPTATCVSIRSGSPRPPWQGSRRS